MNLDRVKNFIAKNRPVIAIAIVATATVAAVVIDVTLRDNSDIEIPESN
jgi:hypothetical protein